MIFDALSIRLNGFLSFYLVSIRLNLSMSGLESLHSHTAQQRIERGRERGEREKELTIIFESLSLCLLVCLFDFACPFYKQAVHSLGNTVHQGLKNEVHSHL